MKIDISREWCLAAANREGDSEVGAGALALDPAPQMTILKTVLGDVFDAIEALYGTDGLERIVDHCRAAERARASNAEIDEIEAAISSGQLQPAASQPFNAEKK